MKTFFIVNVRPNAIPNLIFYEARSTSQVIGRECSEPGTGKVEKSIFPTVRVVPVSTGLLE